MKSQTSQESDFKVESKSLTKREEKEKDGLESYFTNFIFSLMILMTLLGTGLLCHKLKEFTDALHEHKSPDYKFPHVSDLYISGIATVVLCVKIYKK
jgi:hypothetical protein